MLFFLSIFFFFLANAPSLPHTGLQKYYDYLASCQNKKNIHIHTREMSDQKEKMNRTFRNGDEERASASASTGRETKEKKEESEEKKKKKTRGRGLKRLMEKYSRHVEGLQMIQ